MLDGAEITLRGYSRWLQENSIFSHSFEPIVIVIACMRTMQAQGRQSPSMDEGQVGSSQP